MSFKVLKKIKKSFKYDDLVDREHPNIVCIAGTGSGKSLLVANTINNVIQKLKKSHNMRVIVNSPTVSMDSTYREILPNTEIIEHDTLPTSKETSSYIDFINEFTLPPDGYYDPEKKDEPDPEDEDLPNDQDDNIAKLIKLMYNHDFTKPVDEKGKKKKLKKMKPVLQFLVIDDHGNATRNHFIRQFLKKNRHYKTMVFIIIHDCKDIYPDNYNNVHDLILFKGLPEDRVKDCLAKFGIITDELSLDALYDLYRKLTDVQYSYMRVMPYAKVITNKLLFKKE